MDIIGTYEMCTACGYTPNTTQGDEGFKLECIQTLSGKAKEIKVTCPVCGFYWFELPLYQVH